MPGIWSQSVPGPCFRRSVGSPAILGLHRLLRRARCAVARDESPPDRHRPDRLRAVRRADLSAVYDVAVVGSGFAGSLFAMIAQRLGRSVVLLERGRHPRFAIGESSTPLSNLLLEDLSLRYNLPGLTPLAKWGTWREAYPNVDC